MKKLFMVGRSRFMQLYINRHKMKKQKRSKKYYAWKYKWKRKKRSKLTCLWGSGGVSRTKWLRYYHSSDRTKTREALNKIKKGVLEEDVKFNYNNRNSAKWDLS